MSLNNFKQLIYNKKALLFKIFLQNRFRFTKQKIFNQFKKNKNKIFLQDT